MAMNKVFVNVQCNCAPDGTLRPIRIFWDDGRTWNIARTLHIASPVDGEFEGIRYTVLIGSAEKHIYRIGSRWYVEPVRTEEDTS